MLLAAVDIMCEFLEVVLHQFFYFTGYYESGKIRGDNHEMQYTLNDGQSME